MNVTSEVLNNGKTLRIIVIGKLDYHLHNEFRNAYVALKTKPELVELDLSKTDYLDSSGLGMLLLLREQLDFVKEVKLLHPNPQVKKVLDIANFERIFTIES